MKRMKSNLMKGVANGSCQEMIIIQNLFKEATLHSYFTPDDQTLLILVKSYMLPSATDLCCFIGHNVMLPD